MRVTRRLGRTTALTLAAALLLSACGSDPDTDTATDDGAAGDTTDEDAADDGDAADEPEPVADGVTEVPIWIAFTDYRLDWARDRAAEFNDLVDGYAVTIQGYDNYEALFDATQLAADQGNPPAVVQYFEAATTDARDAVTAAGEPLFTSIEDAIGGRDEILGVPVTLTDVVDPVAAYYTIDGSFSSMPWNTSSALMFANRDMMASYGIDDIPTTWQELEAACETVMGADDAPTACITWPNHGWFFEQQLALQDQTLVNNDNGRAARADEVQLTSDAALDFVQWWSDMEDAGYYVYSGTQRDWDGAYNAFASQQVPFILYSSSDTTALTQEGVDGGFEVEAAFQPRNADRADGGALIGGATMWLSNGLDPEVQDVALAFLNFWTSPENDADWHQVTGYVPVTNSAIELLESEGWFDENPNSRVASDQLAAAPTTPATAGALVGNFVAIRDVVTEAIEDILVNDRDVAERMEQAQQSAQQLLDEYNALFGG